MECRALSESYLNTPELSTFARKTCFIIIIAFLGSGGLRNRNILTWMRLGKAVKHSHHTVQRHLISCRWVFTKWKWHSGHKRESWHVCWERHLWQSVCSLFLTCLCSHPIQDMETVRETQHTPASALLAESLPAWHNAYSMRLVSGFIIAGVRLYSQWQMPWLAS